MARIDGSVLTETDGVDAFANDAESDQVLTDGQGTTFPEGAVVLGCSALVAVTLDIQHRARFAFEIACDALYLALFAGLDGGFVEVEIDRLLAELIAVFVEVAWIPTLAGQRRLPFLRDEPRKRAIIRRDDRPAVRARRRWTWRGSISHSGAGSSRNWCDAARLFFASWNP